MRISFFGSSLVSCYWNGAATYYRGLLKALAAYGIQATFYEPDAYDRQSHRDMPDPDWARVVVYPATPEGWRRALDDGARDADILVKASGVGAFDRELEIAVPQAARSSALAIYWDVDAPATLDAIAADPTHHLRPTIPRYDLILTYGGGAPVIEAYRRFGARRCTPIYNAVDPQTHHPAPARESFQADLSFLGNRLPDREARVEAFFLRAAMLRPECSFLLGGAGWDDKPLPRNVRRAGHVGANDHNAFYCSSRATLNINRDSMARYGFSPPTRIFEAAGAGACLITDRWVGIEEFLEPGREILTVTSAATVAATLDGPNDASARRIGEAARARVPPRTPMRIARVRCSTFSASAPIGGRRRNEARHRHSRPVDHLLLGQWPCDHLSCAGQGARGARPFRHLPRTRRALVSPASRSAPSALLPDRTVSDAQGSPAPTWAAGGVGGSRDSGLVRSGRRRHRRMDHLAGARADRLLRHRHARHALPSRKRPRRLCRRPVIPRFDLYLSFTGGPALAHIEAVYGAQAARPLYCAVDPDLHTPQDVVTHVALGYIGTYSQDRQPRLDRLLIEPARRLPELRFAVAGPQYPADIAWPANVERTEHLAPDEHARFYCGQRYTLNVTRADMAAIGYSPSVRLFEAAACGVPIITDRWPGIEEFFAPDKEILIADRAEQVAAFIREIPEERRREMAAAARARALARHAARERARELEEHYCEALARRRRPAGKTKLRVGAVA